MVDKKITDLSNLSGDDLALVDKFVVVDVSADETKSISVGDLNSNFVATVTEGISSKVSKSGDTMTGALSAPDLYLSGGVYFNGTESSNLLDDYEEGTFTAQMFDAPSGGNTSPSTTTGRYTKIGRLVFASFSISNVDTSGLTAGNAAYFALPFTNNGGVVVVGSVRLYANVDDRTVTLASQVLSGGNRVSIVQSRYNTSLTDVLVGMFNSGATDVSVSIVYQT